MENNNLRQTWFCIETCINSVLLYSPDRQDENKWVQMYYENNLQIFLIFTLLCYTAFIKNIDYILNSQTIPNVWRE